MVQYPDLKISFISPNTCLCIGIPYLKEISNPDILSLHCRNYSYAVLHLFFVQLGEWFDEEKETSAGAAARACLRVVTGAGGGERAVEPLLGVAAVR